MKLADLKLNPDNPRNIKEEKLDKLAQSIKDFPKMMVKRPIVYDENKIIIGGNMRYRAIKKLGMEEVPDDWTSDASDFTPEERHRFIMQDNAEMGEHDWDLVANQYELEDLDAWGIDVPYADPADEVEGDEAPEVSGEPPVSQLGVVYQLGRHRVMCGDSTDKANVELLMNGQKADMVFTDPPYGVSYEEKTKNIVNQRKDTLQVMGDDMGIEEMGKIVQKAFVNLSDSIKDGAGYYVCSPQGGDMELMMMMMMRDAGIKCRHQIIWKKDAPVFSMGRLDYDYIHEPILYGWKKSHQFYSKNERSVWEIARPKSSKLHPTMKPIELCAKAIKNSSKDGDIVIDLFGGSGSTLIACEQTDRTCYGMELDPKYVDVIRKRYAKFVGEEDWEAVTPAIQGNNKE